MKKPFEKPIIDFFAYESEDILTVSGLTITDGSAASEQSKSFAEVSNIFNGVL